MASLSHRPPRAVLLAGLLALSTLGAPPALPRAGAAVDAASVALSTREPGLGWTRLWDTPVYAAPSFSGELITRLDRNQRLAVRGVVGDAQGMSWTQVLLWNTFTGWIPGHFVAARPAGHASWGAGPAHPRSYGPHPASPVAGTGDLSMAAYLRAAPAFAASRLRRLSQGTPLAVDSWAVDSSGNAWYHGAITTPVTLSGWVWGGAVYLRRDHSTVMSPQAALKGAGMWCTYPLLQSSSPRFIVAAAVRQGITHLYVEVARSNDGFYGQAGLAALLPVAHAAGLKVFAWVYPYLVNIPHDVTLTVQAARFRAPSGDLPDGVVADVEENMAEPDVRTYGQVVRALLGPNVFMGAAVYPPQSGPGKAYPYATVARSWDALMPMDYWHTSQRSYTEQQSYTYVAHSIAAIRRLSGVSDLSVEPVGQAFNIWENGLDTPTAAEVRGAVRAARDSGVPGISFFEWNHASPEQWRAIAAVSPPAVASAVLVAHAAARGRQLRVWLAQRASGRRS